jgi:DNA-binding NarL/FixJ family response regulator
MDIAMPGLNGLEATRQISRRPSPASKVLILSAHSDDAYVEQRDDDGSRRLSAQAVLRACARRGRSGRSTRAKLVIQSFHRPATRSSIKPGSRWYRQGPGEKGGLATRLTPREAEVLQLVAEGQANKQTAAELGISIKTVEKHRAKPDAESSTSTIPPDSPGMRSPPGIIESSVQLTILQPARPESGVPVRPAAR